MDNHTSSQHWSVDGSELDAKPGWRRAMSAMMEDYKMKRGLVFGGILIAALGAFEIFNFSTTDFALGDILGDERFIGIRWATILAIAFCGIDFAGLARLFTPTADRRPQTANGAAVDGQSPAVELWYLIGAWFLGATLNAVATWWAVTLTLLNHNIGNEVLSREELLTYVPIFVAMLVWLTRILIIGTFSVAGERLFTQAGRALGEAMPQSVQAQSASYPREANAAGYRQAASAHVIGQPGGQARVTPNYRPQTSQPAAPFTRPAPKPSVPASRPAPGDDRDPFGDEPMMRPDGHGRAINGANASKEIE